MNKDLQRDLLKLKLREKGNGYNITHPINARLLNMIIEDALKEFKAYYGRFDKRLLSPRFRSYKYTINGCMLHIETTYSCSKKYGQTYDMNQFL